MLFPWLSACRADASQESERSFRLMKADSAVARKLPHRGSIVQTAAWRDRLGVHTLLLTETGEFPTPGGEQEEGFVSGDDAELYAYDYIDSGANPTLLWRTTDFERACEFDLVVRFVRRSLTVTDLDNDGVGEVTMLYVLMCTGGYDGATLKLIMREGEAKYAIRGTTRLQDPYGGGEMKLDRSFDGAPPAFREHAVRRWNLFVSHERAFSED
jgi:hypothetical protein